MADGNIDNLNFGVILQDTDFNKKIASVQATAEKFNSDVTKLLDISVKLTTKDVVSTKGVSNAEAMAGHLSTIISKMDEISGKKILVGDVDALNETLLRVLDNLDKMNEKTEKGKTGFQEINTQLNKSQSVLGELAKLTGIAFGTVGIKNFVSSLVRITGEFEVQKMALTSMLQDAGRADQIFNQLRKNALESPYTFQDLSKYAKQLTAFNIDADKLVETEKRLADVAAGLGVDMGRIILAYGQVKSAGVLKGTELRQFTEAGVPLLQSLADQIERTTGKTINLAKVFDMISKKQIPFEMVEQAFRDMTAEGGKFYNMQGVLVETLQGKIGKLRDVWQQVLYDIGQSNSGVLKGMVDRLIEFVSHLQEMGDVFNALLKGIGAYGAALALLAPLQGIAFGVQAIANLKNLIASIRAAKDMAQGYAIAMTAAKSAALAIGVAVTVLTLIAQRIKKAREEQNAFNEAIAKCTRSIAEENKELDRLMKIAKDEKRSMEERKGAIDNINQQYGEYLKNMGAEKVSVDNLTTSYDNLREAISNKYLEELKQQTVGLKRTALNNAENELIKFNAEVIKKAGVGDVVMGGLTAAIQKIITNRNPLIDKMGLYNLISKEYADRNIKLSRFEQGDLYGFIDDMIEASDALKVSEKRFEDFAKGYNASMGTVAKATNAVNDATKNSNAWVPTDNKASQKAKQNISTTIDSIKELQRAYKDYKAMGLQDDAIKKIFSDDSMFGYINKDLRQRFDFWEMLLEQAKEMEKYDRNEAIKIRNDVMRGQADEAKEVWKDQQKEIQNAQKALEKYQTTLRKWMNEDFNLSGTGFEYDINKIISNLNTSLGKVDEKYIEAVHQAEEAHKGDTAAIEQEILKLQALRDAEKDYVRAQAQNSMDRLAESYLKDQYLLRGVNLDHAGSMSLKQLSHLKEELMAISKEALNMGNQFSGMEGFLASLGLDIRTLTEDDFESLKDKLPESTLEMIRLMKSVYDTGLSFDTLQEKIQSAIQKGLRNLDDQERKSIAKLAKYAASQVLDLADAFKELGDASGNAGLSEAAGTIGKIADIAKNAIAGFQAGGWIGAAIGALTSITKILIESEQKMIEFDKQVISLREEIRHTNTINSLSSNGIFGQDDLARLRKANDLLDDARERISQFSAIAIKIGKLNPFEKEWWINFFAAANNEYADFNRWSGLLEEMEKRGFELYDENGILSKDMLEAARNLYPEKEAEITALIGAVEEYQEALKTIDEISQSIVGGVVASAADQIVESWWEAGQAALDYTDILGDVAKAYAKLIVQDMLLKEAFGEDQQKKFREALKSGDAETAMAVVAQAMQSAKDMLPIVNNALQAFEPYRQMTTETAESNSLGAGIKSITEETASLLASYINAIRADVSYMRVMQETGWKDVASIASVVATPTLNDYLAQIAANSYNNDFHTQQILMELQSVIGAPGTTGAVVRVERTN